MRISTYMNNGQELFKLWVSAARFSRPTMIPSKTFLSLLFTVLSAVDAIPVSRGNGKGTLSFATKLNDLGTFTLSEKDRNRAQAMKQVDQLSKRQWSTSVVNSGVAYTANVGVGEPASNFSLLIDTGSSNTFLGVGSTKYAPTKASEDTGHSVSVSYGSGSWSGEEWLDTVTLSPQLVIDQQSIGVASQSSGFNGVDGILGIGPTDLTKKTVADTDEVPTVVDNLYSQNEIWVKMLGVYFVPISEPDNNGELMFGGYNPFVTTSFVNYVPLTKTSPASTFWGVDGSVSYNDATILSNAAGIVDTGTTLVLLATDAFQKYQTATGATMDDTTGLLALPSSKYDTLKTFTFEFGGKPYDLSPNAQIWPRSKNTDIGGSSDKIYLVIADIGSPSGSGLDFITGYAFLERYYTVYDSTNQQVGFASTFFTDSTCN
ncbi:acid protease [Chiua virens]|nr:acid protease [Chiua virens]